MAYRLARKMKRAGKGATQFRFTSTLEYIEVACKGTWRPEQLRVIWLRSHRRVHSQAVQWVATDDQGPNGAEGKAVFDPPIAISLIVTLYRDIKKAKFDVKDYKYYIQNEGMGGKKILAAFTANLAEFVDITATKHQLSMKLEPMSKKVRQATLALTIETEFLKEGRAEDDDMQSTFSAVSLGEESLQFDDDDDVDEDEMDEAATTRAGSEGTDGVKTVSEPTPSIDTDKMLPTSSNHVGLLKEEQSNAKVAVAAAAPSSSSNSPGKLKTSSPDNSGEPASSAPAPGVAGMEPPKGVDGDKPTEPSTKQSSLASPTLLPNSSSPPISSSPPKISVKGEQKLTPAKNAPSSPTPVKNPQQPQEQQTTSKEPAVGSCSSETGAQPPPQHSASHTTHPGQAPAKPATNGSTASNSFDFFYQTSLLLASPAPNGPTNQGPPSAAGMESPKGVDSDKSTEPSTKQCSLASPTLPANTSSPPKFPAIPEQELSPEKDIPSSLAPAEDPQQQKQQPTAKEPAIGSQLPEAGAQPSQHSTSDSAKPGQTAAVSVANGSSASNGFDFFYQTSLLLGNDRIVPPVSEVEETEVEETDGVSPTCTSDPVTSTWLPDLSLVDSNNAPTSSSRVEEAKVLGLYFSAEWCQPCRRFLPKLIRLYKILHKHQKPFEVIYVSNDNSETDMSRYMAEQKMPWVALPYGHALIKNLKRGYNVKSIPMLKIVSVDGSVIDENARKMVEAANVESTVLKLFAQWMTGEEASPEEKTHRKASSPTLLNSLKKSLGREGSFSSSSPDSPRADLAKGKGQQRGREAAVEELLQKITEKDQKVRHLEEVNMSLKQTNDDLNEDVANLKIKLKQAEEKLEKLQQSTDRLLKEEQTLKAQMELRGWLYKRGLKGPTAHVWRRRFFRLDQGSKICYYKTATERSPQGFIDLLKVVNVSEVSPAQQDKNNATFHVQCEGRTYQMQAVDETTMRKWMAAIEYLRGFYSTQGRQ